VRARTTFRLPDAGANKMVGAIHPKAMPVILTKPEEFDARYGAA
jgi:hypothetical protein